MLLRLCGTLCSFDVVVEPEATLEIDSEKARSRLSGDIRSDNLGEMWWYLGYLLINQEKREKPEQRTDRAKTKVRRCILERSWMECGPRATRTFQHPFDPEPTSLFTIERSAT